MDSMCENSIRAPIMDQVDRSIQTMTMNNVVESTRQGLEKSTFSSSRSRKGHGDDDDDNNESLPPTNGENSNDVHP